MNFYLLLNQDNKKVAFKPTALQRTGVYATLSEFPHEFHLQRIFDAVIESSTFGNVHFKLAVASQEIKDGQVLLSYYTENNYAKGIIANYFLKVKSRYTIKELRAMHHIPAVQKTEKRASIFPMRIVKGIIQVLGLGKKQ